MPNIIDCGRLTSAGAGARRDYARRNRGKRRIAPLAARGSLVGISAGDLPKRGRLTEEFAALDPAQPASSPTSVGENGRKPRNISLRSMERAWLKLNRARYAGMWVALEGAKLVAQGSSARSVLNAAMSEGYEQPLVVHIPNEPELPFGGW